MKNYRKYLSEEFEDMIDEQIPYMLDIAQDGLQDEGCLDDSWHFWAKTEFDSEGNLHLAIIDLFSVYRLGLYLTGGEDYDTIVAKVKDWIAERVKERTPGLVFYELIWGNEETGDMDTMDLSYKHIFFDKKTAMEYAAKYSQEGEVQICKNCWVGGERAYISLDADFVKCATK